MNTKRTPVTAASDFDRLNRDWYIDKAVQALVFIGGISAIIFIIGIFVFITKEGLGFLVGDFNFKEFFFSPNWRPTSENKVTYGILALIAGTASVTGLAMLIAIPFSLGTAIFDVPVGLNVLNAGIILGLMAAPIMTSIAEDALKAVPDRYREAAEAMGATRWQMIFKVVLPAAKNGLLGAVLLGVGRGFGETMAVLMATGHSINIPGSVFDSVRALTATIAAELGETAVGSQHYKALFTIGISLFVITFIINLVADLVVRGVRKG